MNLLYPKRCPGCDDVLYDRKSAIRPRICAVCEKKLPCIRQPICLKCGKQLDEEEAELCGDCRRRTHFFERGMAAFSYSDLMKNSMYAFKYNNRREYAEFYAESIYSLAGEAVRAWRAEVMIPVPLHRSRERARGYNQANVLAGCLSPLLGIPVDNEILYRIRKTIPQKELNDRDRLGNIKNAFITAANDVKYKRIILVDDIYTTGTTIDECARCLKAAGAEKVFFLTVCVGRGF